MPKPDFTRSLRWMREGTERRRKDRTRRTRTYAMAVGGFVLILVLALPSLLSFSPFIHNFLSSTAGKYGWQVSARDIRIGWVTPLRIRGLEGIGESGKSLIAIESIDAPITILDLIRGKTEWGTINLDSPRLESEVYSGGSSFEDDLAAFLEEPSSGGEFSANVVMRDAALKLIDRASGKNWRVDQLQSTADVSLATTSIHWEGVVTDPDGISGALQGDLDVPNAPESSIELVSNSEGVPLSLVQLAAIRFPQSASSLPQQWSGNATGKVSVSVASDGNCKISVDPLDLRNLIVVDPRITGPTPWKVGHALLQGSLNTTDDMLQMQHFSLQSDAGNASLNGDILLAAVSQGRYLDSMYGDFSTDFDLAALSQSTPGLIPYRADVVIQSGRIQGRIQGGIAADSQYRSSWNLKTESIRAIAAGSLVVLDPLSADITLRPSGNWVTAEKLQIVSSFGGATASGDLRSGQAQFNLDFGRLSSMLGSIIDLPSTSLQGKTTGTVHWSVGAANTWTLQGNANARDLSVSIPGGQSIVRPSLDIVMDAQGVWGQDSLERLDRADIKLSDPNQSWQVSLAESVQRPDANTLLPLRIRGTGSLQAIAALAGPWLPSNMKDFVGELDTDIYADVASRSGRLKSAVATLKNASVVVDQRRYDEKLLEAKFVGDLKWPSMEVLAKECIVKGYSVSFSLQGDMGPQTSQVEIAYRADLSRLQGAIKSQPNVGTTFSGPSPNNTVVIDSAWRVSGSVEGRAEIKRNGTGPWLISFDNAMKEIKALQPPAVANVSGLTGPIPKTNANLQPTVVWQEPSLNIAGNIELASDASQCVVEKLSIQSPWLTGDLRGKVTMDETGHTVLLQGPAKIDTRTAGDRISSLLGEPIQMTGVHETDLTVKLVGRPGNEETMDVGASVGWQSANIAGVFLGPSIVPIRVTEHIVFINPATIPLQKGQINVAGEVHYRPGVLWFEQRPGMFAEGIALTPEMCRSWLKYMMPLVADATEVNGSFSVELSECVVIPSDPVRSRVVGTLNVEGAAVGPGPLANRVITLVDQIEMAAKGLQGQAPAANSGKQWIQMNPQAIDFSMIAGQVSHQRILMKMGKAELISSGSVAIDGRLNLQLQIPLNADWLGSNFASLAGKPVIVPIKGTLSSPGVDGQAVAATLGQLGTTAVQNTAENYLQKQLDRQLQKLLGK